MTESLRPVHLAGTGRFLPPQIMTNVEMFGIPSVRNAFDVERARGSLRGLDPEETPPLGPSAVDRTQNVGEAAYAVLRKHFDRWQRHDAGTRLGEDPEELHDMRVAIRRMRAALRLYVEFLPAPVRSLNESLRWVAQATGDARDLDVQMEQLAHWRDSLAGEDPAALDALE